MILAIEVAIAGGSLSLTDNCKEVSSWLGDSSGLKAEYLLSRVISLLESVGADKRSLNKLVVSAGPGSFTGIRIGIATALGLKNALGVPLVNISALEAIALFRRHTGIVAVPMGRGWAAAQHFHDGISTGDPFTIAVTDLFGRSKWDNFLVHEDLVPARHNECLLTTFGRNIALALAAAADERARSKSPIFLSRGT